MDYEAIRTGMEQAIPFNQHVGIGIAAIADGDADVVLPDAAHTRNHVGSQHAGALFTAAEAASGAAVVGAFAERLGTITPLVKSVEIHYRKLARGPITARGRLTVDKNEILAALDRDGRAQFPVHVELVDGEAVVVAEATAQWHLRAIPQDS